jgi:hypothetical protein
VLRVRAFYSLKVQRRMRFYCRKSLCKLRERKMKIVLASFIDCREKVSSNYLKMFVDSLKNAASLLFLII